MTSKLNINWLNKCRCGNRMHTVETVRGSHVRLFEDDAVKCNACGREGVIQTCDGIATVLWETDEERAEGVTMTKSTKGPLFAEVHNVPDDYHFTEEELDRIIAGDMFTPRQTAIMARELQERRKPLQDKDLQGVIDALEHPAGINAAGKQVVRHALVELQERRKAAIDSEPVAYIDKQWTLVYYVPPMSMGLKIGDKLYRHAQPVPVVSADLLHTAASAIEDLLEHTDPNTSYYSGVWADVPGKLRAAMPAAAPQSPGSEPATMPGK